MTAVVRPDRSDVASHGRQSLAPTSIQREEPDLRPLHVVDLHGERLLVGRQPHQGEPSLLERERLLVAHAVAPRQPHLARARRGRREGQDAVVRNVVGRRTRLVEGRRVDLVFHRDAPPGDLEPVEIEGRRVDRAVQDVDEVTAPDVARLTAALDQDLAFVGFQGLRDDRRVGPGAHAASQREQHPLAAGQQLGSVGVLAALQGEDLLGLTTGGRQPPDALVRAADVDVPVLVPVDSHRALAERPDDDRELFSECDAFHVSRIPEDDLPAVG